MTDRVKCTECDNMILRQTAEDNDGLCGQCARIPSEIRAEKREYDRQLGEGLVFAPSDQERASALTPADLSDRNVAWVLQPEYYADSDFDSVRSAIAAAKSESNGNAFLVSDKGGQLNVGFNEAFAVCEYQNQESGDFPYAYSQDNLSEQVPVELHVIQACPCCGVGLLWYPSRYHMPRDQAFSILEDVLTNRNSANIEWLETDDFSYIERGRG